LKNRSPDPSDAVYFDVVGEVKMFRKGFAAGILAIVFAGLPAYADVAPGAERVVAALRDLFPEIDSEATIESVTGRPAVRLTARVGFDAARSRVRQAFDTARVLAAGVILGPPSDRAATRDVVVSVDGPGGVPVGSFTVERGGRGIAIVVTAAEARGQAPSRPPARILPQPVMWLFPVEERR
jgi:hypothetical protein